MEPSSSLPALRVLDSFQVSPAPGSSVLDDHETSIPFTFFDLLWVLPEPITVERIFFYPFNHTTSYFLSNHLPALKSSLSVALREFYPLAGKFRRTPGTDDRFELYCKESDAVVLTVAELEGGLFEVLSSGRARSSDHLQQLVPPLLRINESQPLLAVQVTVFPQQGIALGVSVNHVACDGTSSMQFIRLWAATFIRSDDKEEIIPSARDVVIDRSLFDDSSDFYSLYYNKIVKHMLSNSNGKDQRTETRNNAPSAMVLASFTLNQEHIQTLKKRISEKAQHLNKNSFHCSTLVVAFAYAWVSHVRVRRTDPDKNSCFVFSADFRARLNPPLPTTYFGNCIWPCLAQANVADLISNDGIVTAAEAIGKAIDGLSASLKSLEHITNLSKSFRELCVVPSAGSPKFRVYDVDFGWGRPAKVEVVSIVKTCAVSVADSREEQGGVEIGVALPKSMMDCFEKYFFGGLETLP